MTDKDLGTAAGDIFAKAFTLGYETGRNYIPAVGMALTAEQVEDVRIVLGLNGSQDIKVVLDAQARLRALFPATEPAAVRDGSDLVVVQRSHTAKAVQSWMTLDLWTDLGKNDNDFDAEYERQGFGDLWATLLGEVRALVQATTPAPAEPAEEETKAVTFDEIAQSLKRIGDAESSFGFNLRFWRRIAEKLIAKYPHLASSPVVPAPTETGPWQTWQEVPEGVKYYGVGDTYLDEPVVYVNRPSVVRHRVEDGKRSSTPDYEVESFAPFVAAEEG